jgi:hypothetical protein
MASGLNTNDANTVNDAHTADDADTESRFTILGDPLWGMAIVSGILLATLAALMASA